jgi:hypothetical protein
VKKKIRAANTDVTMGGGILFFSIISAPKD